MQVQSQESDWEDEVPQDASNEGPNNTGNLMEPVTQADGSELEDGMLPRDLPKRTTFHDPVAERQMSQTDAKLFYQRSKVDSRAPSTSWPNQTPIGSPVIVSGSRGTTEYGGDSLLLEHDDGEYCTTRSLININYLHNLM